MSPIVVNIMSSTNSKLDHHYGGQGIELVNFLPKKYFQLKNTLQALKKHQQTNISNQKTKKGSKRIINPNKKTHS